MWLEAEPLFLDTETTGLLDHDQIIELAISDRAGRILFESRFKPTVEIDPGAYDAHGITIEELDNAPSWAQHLEEITTLLSGKPLIIFNADFDTRLLEQTCTAFSLDTAWINTLSTWCAMYLAADAYGATNRYGTISLNDAACMAGVKWKGSAHSAAADTLATVDLVTAIAGYWQDLNQQLQELLDSKN